MLELIGTLDVEERAREKDGYGKAAKTSTANMVQKKNLSAFYNQKKKNQQENIKISQDKQPSLRRKTRKEEVALFEGKRTTRQVLAQNAK